MPYCVTEDIASDFKNIIFDTASTVTAVEVTEMIDQSSAFIDSYIASTYQVPVVAATSPNAFKVLKMICIFLVADRVRHILYTKTGQDSKDQDTKGLYSLSRNPRKDLKDIKDGLLKLTDALSVTSGLGFDTGCKTPFFDPCKDQW